MAVLVAALLAVPGVSAVTLSGPRAGDWPQFRGARRDGVAVAAGPIAPWRGSPKVRWRARLGEGYSGVSVAAGAVYTTYAREDGEYIARFDDRDGREVWKRWIGANFQAEFTSGPRATPAVDGDSVYVLGSLGNLVALNAASGEERWSVDLGQRFAVPQPRFGYASSPLLAGDLLLVQAGGEKRRYLAALDAKTGTVDWVVCADDAGYSSPIALTLDGEPQFVFITLKEILGVSPAGHVLWTFPWPGENNIATPIFLPPNRLFASHNEDDGGVLLELAGGAAITVREVWRSRFLKNHFSSSVLHDGYLYGFDNATLRCIDAATGESRWAHRGLGKGSLIAAGGRLIVLGDLGDLVLADASPAGYRELARAKVFEERSWTAPSLAGSRLYLRNQTELISFDLAGREN
ncbi:MAG TPA: PQQ-binding-like beta-propeller repeat protein [Thermoanaerobaculia bacterium]|nr:PQQ-binding-like beta-propeller repeat protein [Thermoanaerobaculia bacterium]